MLNFNVKFQLPFLLLFAQSVLSSDTSGATKAERQKFWVACQDGNEGFVLKHPELVRESFADTAFGGFTPLHYAAGAGNKRIIEFLIENGADLEAQSDEGETPLVVANCKKDGVAMRMLLDAGARTDWRDENGNTYLHHAALIGTSVTVKILLDRNLDVNVTNSLGHTPLHIAASIGKLENAKTLVKAGADLTKICKKGLTPLIVAIKDNRLPVVGYLLSFEPVKQSLNDDNVGQAFLPLFFAVREKNVPIIDLLLANHARADIQKDGVSPLDLAYWLKRDDIVRRLTSALSIPVITDAQAKANMLAFFAEIDKEEKVAAAKSKKRRRNKKAQSANTIENAAVEIEAVNSGAPVVSDPITAVTDEPVETAVIEIADEKIPVEVATEQKTVVKDKSPSATTTTTTTTTITTTTPTRVQPMPTRTGGYQVLQHEKLKWPKGISASQQKHMATQLRQLKNWPNTSGLDVKKLQGFTDTFRVRINSFRIVFTIDEHERSAKIHEIGLRKKVYKNLSVDKK